MKLKQSKLVFFILFLLLGLITLQINFTNLMGANVSFTLFDFFGPIAGSFLGPFLGVITVFIVELVNLLIKQTPATPGVVIRLFPTLFATYYFAIYSKKQKNVWFLAIPVIAIATFIANPIGRTVWYYALFWLIPILAYSRRNNVFFRSLGATFTAHAVGGAAWIWAFSLPARVWDNLIPIVIQERLLFAAGITASYFVMQKVLNFLMAKKILPQLRLSV